MPPTAVIALFVFLFGAVVGSFLNVCIYRMPLNQSVVAPGSHCMGCGTAIRWYDNIPIFSWLLLRGRCRTCSASFSIRYPLVELLNALLALFLFLKFGISISFGVMFVFCAALVTVTFIDFDHQIIPDEITGPFVLLGYLASVCMSDLSRPVFYMSAAGGLACLALAFGRLLLPWGHRQNEVVDQEEPFQVSQYLWFLVASLPALLLGGYGLFSFTGQQWPSSLLGIFVGADLICLVIVLWYAVKRQEGMGGGDAKLLAMMGAFLGFKAIPFIIFASSLIGTVAGLAIMVLQRKNRQLAIPFGPYLALAAILYIFVGPQLIQWYLQIGK